MCSCPLRPRAPDLADSKHNNLASLHKKRRETEKARQLFLECEQTYSAVYGPDHSETQDAAAAGAETAAAEAAEETVSAVAVAEPPSIGCSKVAPALARHQPSTRRGTSGSDNVSTRDERSHQIGKHRRCILRGMRSATTFGEARLQQFHWR